MGSLRHSNLCMIEAASMNHDSFYLIMEIMETSLAAKIQNCNISKEKGVDASFTFYELKSIAIDICRGMIALHSQ